MHRRGASETTAFFKSMLAKEQWRATREAADEAAAGAEGAGGAEGAEGAAGAAGAEGAGEGRRKAGTNMTAEEREMIRREREAMKEEAP